MAHSTLVRLARRWRPDPSDKYGADKRLLIEFCLDNQISHINPKTVGRIIKAIPFERTYTPTQFQHKVLVPLRNDPTVFMGTGGSGVYLVTSPEDADLTLGFYSRRVRAEQRHARNLRKLAKRTKLFEAYLSKPLGKQKKGQRALIFIDESGNPNINDHSPPVFVVAAVVLESLQEASQLEQRFANAAAMVGRPVTQELKTSGLSQAKHRQVLRELSLIDYHWAAACFIKAELTGVGFQSPKVLYKYAFQFLIGELLDIAWQADVVMDEYSNESFQEELEGYLRKQNSGLPVGRLDKLTFASSSQHRLVQLADLVAGAVRRSLAGESAPLEQIAEKEINLQIWPPRV